MLEQVFHETLPCRACIGLPSTVCTKERDVAARHSAPIIGESDKADGVSISAFGPPSLGKAKPCQASRAVVPKLECPSVVRTLKRTSHAQILHNHVKCTRKLTSIAYQIKRQSHVFDQKKSGHVYCHWSCTADGQLHDGGSPDRCLQPQRELPDD